MTPDQSCGPNGASRRLHAQTSRRRAGPPNAGKETLPFRIIATDAGFDAPDHVAAGSRHIVFENRGSEVHEAMPVKLPNGMSANDYMAAVKRGSLFPESALDYSGPGLTSPGVTAVMWLRVDHKFELGGNPHRGEPVIRVETPGPAMHEADFFRLHEGKTVDDLRRWRKEDGRGPAPAEALGGALDNHDLKRVVWLRKNFSPGRYALHCKTPVASGPSATNKDATHADLGMVREFEIKE